MRRKSMTILLAAVLALSISGCKAQNVTRGMGENQAYDAVITVKGNHRDEQEETLAEKESQTALEETAESREGRQLLELAALLGKTDEEAAPLLGGGKENTTADGSYLVGRNYRTELLGEQRNVYSSYGEDGTVFMVLAELENLEASDCVELLNTVTGVTPKEEQAQAEETSAEEEQSFCWEWKDYQLQLFVSGGLITLDITYSAY